MVSEIIIDKEFWRFVNSFAPWFSAFGTLSAVIVSLCLARRDKSVRLEVSAGYRMMVTQGVKELHPEYLVINIVNIGHREAQITKVGWKIGLFRPQYAFQTTMTGDGISSPIPVRLKDGEGAKFFIPLDGSLHWLEKFARDYLISFPSIKSRFVKICVSTSIGKTFEQRIEEGLRKLLVQTARKL